MFAFSIVGLLIDPYSTAFALAIASKYTYPSKAAILYGITKATRRKPRKRIPSITASKFL
jgi:hypothetical protein